MAHPGGASTVDRLAATAARYGYAGLVVANADETEPFDPGASSERHGIDVVDGVTVDAPDVETAAGRLGSVRSGSETRYTLVTVVAGTPALARFAAGQDRVDALLLPSDRDVEFDHVVAAEAADHGVRVALPLDGVLRASGEARGRALRLLCRRREILDDADAWPLVTAGARSHLHLRAPRGLAAVGERVGLGGERVHAGLAGWGEAVERVRERVHPDFVEPGVRRGGAADRDDDPAGGDRA